MNEVPVAPRSPEEISEVAERALAVPLLSLLGAVLINDEKPHEGTYAVIDEGALNAVDTLHAGAIATLLEVTAYLALLPDLDRDEEAATHAFSASYLRSGHAGDDLRCTATVARRSRRLAFVSAELRRSDELIATATVTKSILRVHR